MTTPGEDDRKPKPTTAVRFLDALTDATARQLTKDVERRFQQTAQRSVASTLPADAQAAALSGELNHSDSQVSALKRRLWHTLIWFFGGVLVGLVPLWVEIAKEGGHPSASSVLQHGDLFVASAVLCAASATDRLGRGIQKYDFLGFGAVGSAAATFLGNTIYFTTLDSLSLHGRAVLSIWLFLFAVEQCSVLVDRFREGTRRAYLPE